MITVLVSMYCRCKTSRRRKETSAVLQQTICTICTNPHLIAIFVHYITPYSDLSVIMCNTNIIKMFKATLNFTNPSEAPTQQVTNDTMFNLGDFYLSILLVLSYRLCSSSNHSTCLSPSRAETDFHS